jgi:hypothetical protein
METKTIVGLILSILLIILISLILVCCLGCHKLIKIYPEPSYKPKNKIIISV